VKTPTPFCKTLVLSVKNRERSEISLPQNHRCWQKDTRLLGERHKTLLIIAIPEMKNQCFCELSLGPSSERVKQRRPGDTSLQERNPEFRELKSFITGSKPSWSLLCRETLSYLQRVSTVCVSLKSIRSIGLTCNSNIFLFQKKRGNELGVVVHACNPSTWEDEAGGSRALASLGYTARPYLKRKKKKKCVNCLLT
jgi:hypothetical protein